MQTCPRSRNITALYWKSQCGFCPVDQSYFSFSGRGPITRYVNQLKCQQHEARGNEARGWHLVFCLLPSLQVVQVSRCRKGSHTLTSIMVEITPQLVGLIAGVIVFCCTVVVTFLLLVFGGSFKRMREQVTQQQQTR